MLKLYYSIMGMVSTSRNVVDFCPGILATQGALERGSQTHRLYAPIVDE